MMDPSSISGPITPVPTISPNSGTIVPSATAPRKSALTWWSTPMLRRSKTASATRITDRVSSSSARRPPNSALPVSLATIAFIVCVLLVRDQVGEDALEGLVRWRHLVEADARVVGDSRQQFGETQELHRLHPQDAGVLVHLNPGGGPVGDQCRRERAVVVGANDVLVRPVGHEAADLAEVT